MHRCVRPGKPGAERIHKGEQGTVDAAGQPGRRRHTPDKFSVAGVLQSMNTILHDRQLEEYYCTLCYAFFDFKRRAVTLSNSGLPYPLRCSGAECGQIELPGVPLGSFPGVTYDEVTMPFKTGDVFVFCT